MPPRIARRLSASGVVVLVASFLLVGPAAADACPHLGVRLSEWPTEHPSLESQIDDMPIFYWGSENAGSISVTIQAEGHYCGTDLTTTAEYATSDGTATNSDYTPKSGTVTMTGWDIDWEAAEVQVPVTNDSLTDSRAAEWFKFALTGGEANLLNPKEAPVFIVDDEGAHRVALPDDPWDDVQISESTARTPDPDVQIPVFRAGPSTDSIAVTYQVTGGAGITASDYTDVSGGTVSIPGGQRMATIKLSIADDLEVESSEQLTVQLTGAGSAALADTASSTVSIIDNDVPGGDNIAPETWFHHPKHLVTYKFGTAKARTIHVYAPGEDDEPSGIDFAETALKRVKKDGTCQWWNGKTAWVQDGCGDAARHDNWLSTKFLGLNPNNGALLYEEFLEENLKPSVGAKSNFRFYFVYSRAEDGAGNMETALELGRNKNRFEIKKF